MRQVIVRMAVLVVVSLAVGSGAVLPLRAAAPPVSHTWSAKAEFRPRPDQANPSPDALGNPRVWHYLASAGTGHDPSGYSLLPLYGTRLWNVPGLQGWWTGAGGSGWTSALWFPPADPHLMLHPDLNDVVLGWRSPITGTVRVVGGVTDGDSEGGDGVSWSIDAGSTTIASGAIANGGAQSFAAGSGGAALSSLTVTRGDFLYLVIGSQADVSYDSTIVDLRITPACTAVAPLGGGTVTGTSGSDILCGRSGPDVLRGGGGDDLLIGGGGDDVLMPGTGVDVNTGGGGTDTISYRTSSAPVTVDLRNRRASGQGWDTLTSIENATGGPFGDHLQGDSRPNRLAAGRGGDDLRGRAGNDVLLGEAGFDTLNGGRGVDVCRVGPGGGSTTACD